MARPKTFDKNEALAAALDLFWKKGYACCSMQELVDAMGIGRASLYDTFGSKRELFREVMRLYGERMDENLAPLQRPGPARKIIAGFLKEAAARPQDGVAKCCMVVKAAGMSDPPDEETAQCCRELTQRIEDAFYALLAREKIARPRALARFFTHSVQAIGISSTIRPDRRVLNDIVRTTISVLD
jgi:TetR/AcrR family transcriptional repressor of nem operon